MIDRRSFLRIGLAAIAAPAIVRATSLMPIKVYREGWFVGDGLPLYSVSHPQSLSYLVDFHNGLNEASLEEMIALVQQEDNLFGAHIRIVPSTYCGKGTVAFMMPIRPAWATYLEDARAAVAAVDAYKPEPP